MLAWPKNLLRKKINPSLALLSALALVLAGVLVTAYEEQLYRAQKIQEINAQGQILAASVAAALVFDDDKAAQEYVAAMRTNPELEAAGVYGNKGMRVAGFARSGSEPLPERAGASLSYVSNNRVYTVVIVNQDGARIGAVYLRANLDFSAGGWFAMEGSSSW